MESIRAGPGSGLKIEKECVECFLKLHAKREHKYVLFGLDDRREKVEVQKISKKDSTYDEMVQELMCVQDKGSGCFAAYNCDIQLDNGRCYDKVVFIQWIPDCAKVKNRMILSSTKDAFIRAINWTGKSYQANDADDLRWDKFYQWVIGNEVKN